MAKELLNNEELDNVVGGNKTQCIKLWEALNPVGVNDDKTLLALAQKAFGTDNIKIHLDDNHFMWMGKDPYLNSYIVNDKEISHTDFLNTLVDYVNKTGYHA